MTWLATSAAICAGPRPNAGCSTRAFCLIVPMMTSARPRRGRRWRRALAGTILLGSCDTSQAQAIGALASDARASDVVNWLAALYPPPSEGFSLGTVQPDRLAELLLGPILTRQPDLLGEIGALAERRMTATRSCSLSCARPPIRPSARSVTRPPT